MDQSSNSIPSVTDFGGPANAVLNAFGTVLGYIGAEAATRDVFERLLWPQRFYSGFTFAHVLKSGLLMPMGGPLYKICLHTLDVTFEHGLFLGHAQGHMLNTAFFRQEPWTYTFHSSDPTEPSHTESVRNCLWVRALAQLPMPMLATGSDANTKDGTKDTEKATMPKTRIRAKVSLSHLTLSRTEKGRNADPKVAIVPDDTEPPTMPVYTALFVTEFTGILMAVFVAWAQSSWFAVLWLCPLLLKILSAMLTVPREPLIIFPDSDIDDDTPQDFEIHCPTSNGNFMLITGPPALVLQFFRHYGHPIRNRAREIAQLAIVIAYGCLFPVGLLCSVAGMSVPVQYAWVSYQIYAVLAMYIARYTNAKHWASTEETIAKKFSDESMGRTIIFGGNKDDGRAVIAHLDVTYHNRYAEGRDHMIQLLNRYDKAE
jgi:hypothetical protein